MLACVEPLHKVLEDGRLFSVELYNAAPSLCKASIQSGAEVPRVEREEITVHIEGLFVRASADLDGRCLAEVR